MTVEPIGAAIGSSEENARTETFDAAAPPLLSTSPSTVTHDPDSIDCGAPRTPGGETARSAKERLMAPAIAIAKLCGAAGRLEARTKIFQTPAAALGMRTTSTLLARSKAVPPPAIDAPELRLIWLPV